MFNDNNKIKGALGVLGILVAILVASSANAEDKLMKQGNVPSTFRGRG